MFKLGICEDHLQSLETLSTLITEIGFKNNLQIKIHSFRSGEELLSFYHHHPKYFDILLLDILMDGINGIEVAKNIQKLGFSPAIIFLTTSKEYALDSYDVKATGYLLKPYHSLLIEEKLLEIIKTIQKKRKNTLYVKCQQDLFSLPLDDVVYFESNLRKITAYFHDGQTLEFYEKLSTFEEKIAHSCFIRIHRSYLVHLLYTKNIIQTDLITTTNTRIPISKKYLSATRDAFTSYLRTHL